MTHMRSYKAAKLPINSYLRPCVGGCGKLTRPTNMEARLAPGTTPRRRGGFCASCIARDNPRQITTECRTPLRLTPEEEAKTVEQWRSGLEYWLNYRATHGKLVRDYGGMD